MATEATASVSVEDIVDVLRGAGLSLSETLTLPGRDAQYLPIRHWRRATNERRRPRRVSTRMNRNPPRRSAD
jgi:hypothetical protein